MTHLKRMEYQREYYRTHKAEARAYYKKNRARYIAYSRKYYREHKAMWEDFYTPRAIVKAAKMEMKK